MTDSGYRTQIGNAWRLLLQLVERRQELNSEISKLRELIVAHANMIADEERNGVLEMLDMTNAAPGMSDAIRKILMEHTGDGLTVTEVREKLSTLGCDLTDQSNPLASITTTLRRMVPNSVVEIARPNAKRKFKYKWQFALPLNAHISAEVKASSPLLGEMRETYLRTLKMAAKTRPTRDKRAITSTEHLEKNK